MTNIAILASHNGNGFDALYEAKKNKILDIAIPIIISNNSNAPIIQKAKEYQIQNHIVNDKLYENPDQHIYELLQSENCDYIFLSGYMKKISPLLTNNFQIINAHPSLLPKHGGSGMYGIYVHQAVIKNKDERSGVTIHRVNENYDEGKILLQKSLEVNTDETPESLETRIKQLEKKAIVETFTKLLTCRE